MNLIVAGGRDFTDYTLLKNKLDLLLSKRNKPDVILICGMARGADLLAKQYANENNMFVWEFPADWDNKGKSAGYLRNLQMAEEGTHLVAFWNGVSKGTKHMIDIATKKGLVVRVFPY